MARTVVALFDSFADANASVRELVDNGFSRDDISIMANDATGEYGRYISGAGADNTTSGAGVGAGIGAVVGGLGGLLIGIGALAIPGIGPVIAAGPLAAALTGLAGAGAGAVAGGVAGGLLGALVDMGIPNENAQYYAEGIRRGGTLVTVRTDDYMSERARDIMNHHNPADINERVSQWRSQGWSGFDTEAPPYQQQTELNQPEYNEPVSTPTDMNASSVDTDRSWPAGNFEPDETNPSNVTRSGHFDQTTDAQPVTDVTPHPQYADFNTYDATFRNHFTSTMPDSGYTYEQYQPAYRYGYDLATNTRYQDMNWDQVEPDARRYWDERNPGTWDRIKNAVRYAYDEIRDSLS
ncbi:MAG: hypothetical protein ACM3PY_16535 [Omnitrophica WOR_2 bacterium]